MKSFFKALKYLFIFTLIMAVCLELASYAYIHILSPRTQLPSYSWDNVKGAFWQDINHEIGVWHKPNSKYVHKKTCSEVLNSANSFGMRDKERSLSSNSTRVAVLGDSYMEGFYIPASKRVSDLLENNLGIEFLNFSVAGIGTLQEYLLYKSMVTKFDHNAVLIGILPQNDLTDNLSSSYSRPCRRPYLSGEYPNFTIEYTQEQLGSKERDPNKEFLYGFLREFSYTYVAARNFYHLLKQKNAVPQTAASDFTQSFYYDFTQRQWDGLKFSIEKLAAAADGKPVLLFTIPSYNDFQAYKDATPPLSEKLNKLAKQLNVGYVDLLPEMANSVEDPRKLYLECDWHFSEYGNYVSTTILEPAVQNMLNKL
ncbi:SGNH/GDSL hydrolase family protein [Maridesulfovibrio sp.]|uniref:SGNH/GDSL hydrolase family protein n=1 Tax=Maridesulfovibrio sp. TaxID=2795000 RepID=UPI002A18DE47|nr:SGNH/GDSL hydrolase family protein [Maridesulfovibrio sp.]